MRRDSLRRSRREPYRTHAEPRAYVHVPRKLWRSQRR